MGKRQDLDKKWLELFKKSLAERGDGIVIRVRVGRNKSESNGIIGCFLNLAAGEDTCSIAIELEQ